MKTRVIDFMKHHKTVLIIAGVLLAILFLVVLNKGEPTLEVAEKNDFLVETKLLSRFSQTSEFTKTSKISSASDINLNANAVGRVKEILVKQGDIISAGQPLIRLSDNIANYYLSLQRAGNDLERVKINYDSNKITLDKQVFDAKLALERTTSEYNNIKIQTQQDILQAENNKNDSNISSVDSKSTLELQKIENSIEKANLDYSNSLVGDEQKIEGFKSTLTKDLNAQLIFLDDIIEFADSLLGVTDKNELGAEEIESFLGARDLTQKNISISQLQELIIFRNGDFMTHYNISIGSENDIIKTFLVLQKGYDISKVLLNNLEATINNSVVSVSRLPQSKIDGYLGSLNAYQSALQGNYTAFVSYQNSVDTFFKTYKNNQISLKKTIEILEQDKSLLLKTIQTGELNSGAGLSKTISASENNLKGLEIQLETAKNSLDNAEKTRSVSLRSLQNSIEGARISYNLALKEYQKLTITSPVDGVVGSILVDIAQDVQNGNPVVGISGEDTNELEISFTKSELDFVEVGSQVFLDYEGKTFTGSIFSISSIADANLNYTSKVIFPESLGLGGDLVEVSIPFATENILLPINIVQVKNSRTGTIYTVSSGALHPVDISLGNVYGNEIEILDVNPLEDIQVVTNNVSNFDENKFTIQLNK